MFSKISSCGIRGVEGYPVTVEADVSDGLPGFIMVGYLSEEVREAQERVRTALKNSGFSLPPRKVTINLSPADIRKEGTAFDLAIATAVLCCLGQIEAEHTGECTFIGELGLNGKIKPVKGILSRVYAAIERGSRRCFLPQENVLEGTAVKGIEIVGVNELKEMVELLAHPEKIKGQRFDGSLFTEEERIRYDVDFSELNGQKMVKRASSVAAAGMHNILYLGPAGTGKTMAAKRLPTIMPPITLEESIQVSKIYSICGLLPKDKPLLTTRPFRNPHHSITSQALVGGGRNPKPGEVSLASGGVLFLDELTEFPVRILDLLRQPMEDRKITVARLNGAIEFPADSMLAAAMNPCKCGHYPDRSRCTCTDTQIRQYLSRVSGPFLDRMDIGVEVSPVSYEDLKGGNERENSESMRKKVWEARQIQADRFKTGDTKFNSQMGKEQVREFCHLSKEDEAFLKAVYQKYGFSARAYDKILKTARTIADLDGKKQIRIEHISEAVSYRSFERKYWGFRV
ncbi:MAG: YifB family Mg chelatase-like AAA ATPase [Clostridium sp.]